MKRLILGGLALAFVAGALVTGMAHAEPARVAPMEMSRGQVADLYAIAYGHAGAGVPDRAPVIRVVTADLLQAIACDGPCSVAAYQLEDSVFVRADLDMANPMNAAIVLHEFVHYVQWSRHGPAKDCADSRQREVQAYTIQAFALDRIGLRMAVPELASCG